MLTLLSTCPCAVACHERNFQSTISASTWPSNQYWLELARSTNMYTDSQLNTQEPPKKAAIQQEIQEDYTRAEIYYQTLNIQTITMSPKYDVSNIQIFMNYI